MRDFQQLNQFTVKLVILLQFYFAKFIEKKIHYLVLFLQRIYLRQITVNKIRRV